MVQKRNKSHAFLFQVLIVLGLLTAVWFSFGQNVLAPQKQTEAPKRLGALKLGSSTTGAEALAQVSQLHGTEIEMASAYIADYTGVNERVTVWVGTANGSEAATSLLERMVSGISDGNQSFSNLKRIVINQGYHGHEIYQVSGPGGEHFFYISKKANQRVVWLTIAAPDALAIVEQALNTF